MITKIISGILSLILLTSCAATAKTGKVAVELGESVIAHYGEEVANQSKSIDDLVRQMQKLDEVAQNRGEAALKAQEIEKAFTRLQENRPPNGQLSEETVKLLNKMAEAQRYAQLVSAEDQVVKSTLTRMESASGKSLSIVEESFMDIYLRELLCLNFESLVSDNELASGSDYADFFAEKAIDAILPLDISEFYNTSKSIADFAKEVYEGSTYEEIQYKNRLNQACKSL